MIVTELSLGVKCLDPLDPGTFLSIFNVLNRVIKETVQLTETVAEYLNRRRKEIGESIRQARFSIGWTQQEVADFLGCSRRQVNRVEQGHAEFSLGELELIAKAFRAPLGELISIKGGEFAMDGDEIEAVRLGLPTKFIAKMRDGNVTDGQLFDYGRKIGIPFDVLVTVIELERRKLIDGFSRKAIFRRIRRGGKAS